MRGAAAVPEAVRGVAARRISSAMEGFLEVFVDCLATSSRWHLKSDETRSCDVEVRHEAE